MAWVEEEDLVFTKEDSILSFEGYKDFLLTQKYQRFYNTCSWAYRPDTIENDEQHGVPMMNKIFYQYFKDNHVPPEWEWYVNEYKSRFVIPSSTKGMFTFNDGNPKHQYDFTEPEIHRKIMNGWMSFIKEGYVDHWLWENGFPAAYYSSKQDKNGFDTCIRFGSCPKFPAGLSYLIRLYCYTRRSLKCVRMKDSARVKPPSNSVSIKLMVDIDEGSGTKIGDTFIVPVEMLQAIANIMRHGGNMGFTVLSSEKVDERKMS